MQKHIIRIVLFASVSQEASVYPSAQRAQPEYEFKTVMTTGMSAPPMAMVRVTPITALEKTVQY